MNLGLGTRTEGDWTIVEVSGEMDLHTAPQLRERIHELVGQGKYRIVLDLEELGFMDSTGLGVLVAGLKRLKAQEGDLLLAGAQDPVRKVLTITGLDKVFPIYPSAEEAIRAN